VEPCGNLPGPSGKAKYQFATDSEQAQFKPDRKMQRSVITGYPQPVSPARGRRDQDWDCIQSRERNVHHPIGFEDSSTAWPGSGCSVREDQGIIIVQPWKQDPGKPGDAEAVKPAGVKIRGDSDLQPQASRTVEMRGDPELHQSAASGERRNGATR